MKKILLATDFSTRSDRALRRATLLCRQHVAEMVVVHAIDDDQAPRLIEAERSVALSLLEDQARSIGEIDGVACSTDLLTGDPYAAITEAAERHAAEVIVIGPHRRHVVGDTIVGTTAERIIKASRCPVLMVNGVPAGFYRHIMIALELADSGRDAVSFVRALGIDRQVGVSVLHIFDSPVTSLLVSASIAGEQVRKARLEEEARASREVATFLAELGFAPMGQSVLLNEGPIASAILAEAKRQGADMVVVGTECRTGLMKLVLGSVAEEVLRTAEMDVLAIPPSRGPA